MKKVDQQRTNAIGDAADRIARGVDREIKDGQQDRLAPGSIKSAQAGDDAPIVVRQRRRPRGRKK